MGKLQKRTRALGAFVIAMGTVGALMTGSASAAPTAVPPAYADCPSQHFCAWSGTNGSGSMCHWSGDDPDWYSGSIRCSWASSRNVRSVYNNGTSGRGVNTYRADGSRVGCTASGGAGNYTGAGHRIKSHSWNC